MAEVKDVVKLERRRVMRGVVEEGTTQYSRQI